jgi:hypothetical protein
MTYIVLSLSRGLLSAASSGLLLSRGLPAALPNTAA